MERRDDCVRDAATMRCEKDMERIQRTYECAMRVCQRAKRPRGKGAVGNRTMHTIPTASMMKYISFVLTGGRLKTNAYAFIV